MYKIPEPAIQEYRRKWLEAERDLAIKGVAPLINSANCEPIDNGDTDTERKPVSIPRNLEECQPGATEAEVFEALKKVANAPKPSRKHS